MFLLCYVFVLFCVVLCCVVLVFFVCCICLVVYFICFFRVVLFMVLFISLFSCVRVCFFSLVERDGECFRRLFPASIAVGRVWIGEIELLLRQVSSVCIRRGFEMFDAFAFPPVPVPPSRSFW